MRSGRRCLEDHSPAAARVVTATAPVRSDWGGDAAPCKLLSSSYTPDPRSSQASTVLTSGRGCHSGPTTPLLQTRTTAKSNPCMRRDRLGPLLPPLPPPSGTQDSVQSRVSLKSQLGPHADSCRHTRTHLSRYSSNAFRPPTVHLRTLRSPSSLLSPGAVHPVISSVDI